MQTGMKYTFDNEDRDNYHDQLEKARRLLKEKGRDALYNPHAATGRICGCRDCFCCAALEVWQEAALKKEKA